MGFAARVAASCRRHTGTAGVDCLFLEHVRLRGRTVMVGRDDFVFKRQTISQRVGTNPYILPANRLAFWYYRDYGFVLDLALGALFAPLALYGFARARTGWRHGVMWPLGIWIAPKMAMAAMLAWAMVVLAPAGGLGGRNLIESTLLFRIAFFNIPFWLFLLGIPIVIFDRRRYGLPLLQKAFRRRPEFPSIQTLKTD